MVKKKNERRDARRERAKAAKEAKREAEAEALRTRRRWRLAAIAVAVLSIVLAALSYWLWDERRLGGVSGSVLVDGWARAGCGTFV